MVPRYIKHKCGHSGTVIAPTLAEVIERGDVMAAEVCTKCEIAAAATADEGDS